VTPLTPESAILPEENRTIEPTGGHEPAGSSPSARSVIRFDRVVQTALLALLMAAPALLCIGVASVADPDIWWHLSAGRWMLLHHAMLRVDPFSSSGAGKPWPAYSWLYELLVIQIFQRFGLVGLVGYSTSMVFAITLALWHLIKRLQPSLAVSGIVMLATCLSFGHLTTPRPWMFTILFSVFEINILMQARRTGRAIELAWLPLIFALWSNIHIEFIDGLMVLGLALAEAVLNDWGMGIKTHLRVPWLLAAFAGSVLATLVNPFGWGVYSVGFDYIHRLMSHMASDSGGLNSISELQAMPFRDIVDYSVLFLTLAASAALAARRRFLVFEVGLLLFGAVVSFRSRRDVWVIGIAAAAILASSIRTRATTAAPVSRWRAGPSMVAAALLVLVTFQTAHRKNATLRLQLESELPAAAVDEVRAKGYAGPLYNDFTWGGYLMWALQMPVNIDGRAAFYGDAAINRSDATWMAAPDWASDPQLNAANLVLGPARMPLSQALRMDPHWQLAYEDKLAIVFVRKSANPTR
jgi:hypothetical protein